MTEAVPVRRSRRAASLTAEVLWNLQIEDDKKNKEKSERKNSTSKEIEPSKRGRKRSSVDNKNEGNSQQVDTFKSVPEKKARTQNCTAFPETKPLGGGRRIHGKLTASVAPLMKSPPVAAQRTEVTHNNPILLLPVSLRSDPNPEGISLLTLQTSSDLFSCLGINNKPKVGENWGVTSITQSNTNPQGVRIGIKRCGLTLPTPHTPMYSIKTPRPHTTGQE
uniref:Uncharacterized protein n=1 Tax=Ciona savignyi TaxID=51511 RepID=H2YX47_CIOSA